MHTEEVRSFINSSLLLSPMTHTFKAVKWSLIILSVLLLILLLIVKEKIDEQEAFLCETVHENQLDMSVCPAHTSNMSWYFLVAFAISFLMFGVGIYLVFLQPSLQHDNNRSFKNINLASLDDGERAMYLLLKEKGGSMYQSDLIRELNISKVKATRILDKLAHKEIVDRKRRGMTNIVVLK